MRLLAALRARDVRAPVSLGSLARTVGKQDDGGPPGPACTLSANHSGRAALKKEQREQLVSNHRENRATGKEG
jgi:hypothetical protein